MKRRPPEPLSLFPEPSAPPRASAAAGDAPPPRASTRADEVPRPVPGGAGRSAAVAELAGSLRRRFPGAVAGGDAALPVLPTGVAPLDGLLPGGLPLGRVSVLAGPPSSGRTGLALTAAAAVSARAGALAWIDLPGTLHPPSAAAAGIDLGRLVVVRPARAGGPPADDAAPPHGSAPSTGGLADGLLAATLLLQQRAARLVVLDLSTLPARELARAPGAALTRLARAVATDAACLVLAGSVPSGDALARVASVVIALTRARCTWSGPEPDADGSQPPTTLAGLSTTATLARSRFGGEGRRALVSLVRRSPS